jgi:hypothetical protein
MAGRGIGAGIRREVAHIPRGWLIVETATGEAPRTIAKDHRQGKLPRTIAMYKYFITLMFCIAFARVSSRIILNSGLIY